MDETNTKLGKDQLYLGARDVDREKGSFSP